MLSPRAEKTQREALGRAQGYWPSLARTASKAMVMRPARGGLRYQRRFAQGLAQLLPQFRFNNRRNWWEAPLSQLAAAHEALAPQLHLSEGAARYLSEAAR